MLNFKKLSTYGPLLICIAAFLWALDGVLRRSLYSLPPVVIVTYEHLIGSLLLFPTIVNGWKYVKNLNRREIVNLIWIGLFSGLLGTLWFTTALLKVNFISFSVVFLLQKLQPVFVILAAALILKEKITKQYIQWAIIAIVAAYFVTFKNGMVNFATGAGTIQAALYALGAAFAWGTSTVFSKIALRTKPDQIVTSLRFVFTTVIGFLAVILMGQTASLTLVTPPQIGTLLLIAFSTGMVALAIYYRGLANTEAKVATILELIFPVTAVVIDAVVYKSLLAPTQYLAAGVLLFAALKLSMLRAERVKFTSHKVKGKGRGKQMGFPTINLEIPKKFALRDGIYACYVSLAGKTYQGALHYGPIPTFDESQKSLEVFLLDVDDIADSIVKKSEITIDIVHYIRPVMNFDSVEKLVAQIELDVKRTRMIL